MMRLNYFLFATITVTLFSCNSTDSTTIPEQEKASSTTEKLERELAERDSLINDALSFYAEISRNLESIKIKHDELIVLSGDPELTPEKKERIIAQIKHINHLREENSKQLVKLKKQLKSADVKLDALEKMICKLTEGIRMRDEQIDLLKAELNAVDKGYSRLFDAYQGKAYMVEELTDELHTAYYAIGSEKELAKNQLIEIKKGFIGIGKKIWLNHDFQDKNFNKIDTRTENTIQLNSSEFTIISDHPFQSYQLISQGKNTKLVIKDVATFWKASNYLVIVLD